MTGGFKGPCHPNPHCVSGCHCCQSRVASSPPPPLLLLPQKAVRVTTIMKRLRAPEQGGSRAASPAEGTTSAGAATAVEVEPADAKAPATAASATATTDPVTAATPVIAVTECGAGGSSEPTQAVVAEVEAGGARAQEQPGGAEPASRCNGDAAAPLSAESEAGDEQG